MFLHGQEEHGTIVCVVSAFFKSGLDTERTRAKLPMGDANFALKCKFNTRV